MYSIIALLGHLHALAYRHQVRLEGEWMEPSSDGGITRTIGLRRFQGIGKSTREGRMNAAETALKKLRDMMPGLDVEQGVIPRAWER